jgi:hypothetical protein
VATLDEGAAADCSELVKARRLRACRTSLSRSPLERPRPFGDERYALLAGEEFVLEPALDFDRDLLEVVFVRIEVRLLYQDGSRIDELRRLRGLLEGRIVLNLATARKQIEHVGADITLTVGILRHCACDEAVADAIKHDLDIRAVRNKDAVLALYDLMINRKKSEEATARFPSPAYIQHNPLIPDGPEALGQFFGKITRERGLARVVVHASSPSATTFGRM